MPRREIADFCFAVEFFALTISNGKRVRSAMIALAVVETGTDCYDSHRAEKQILHCVQDDKSVVVDLVQGARVQVSCSG